MSNETQSGEEVRDAVLREQVRIAMQQVPTMQMASFIVALVLSFLVRNLVSHLNILAWVLMIVSIVSSRILLYVGFRKVRDGPFDGRRWKRLYLLAVLVSGIGWGLSAFLIFPAGNQGLISLFVLVIASLSAATTVSHSSLKWGPAAWAGPAMLLYSIRCFLEGGEFGRTVGFLIILYLCTVLRYSIKHNKFIIAAVTLRFENLELLGKLRGANEALHQEITEREQIEETLEKSERFTRTLLDNIVDRIFAKDMEGRYTLFNRACYEYWGIPAGAAIGRTDWDLFDEETARIFAANSRVVLEEGRTLATEETMKTMSGQNAIVSVINAPLRDEMGRVVGLVGVSRDITEIRQTEQYLRESERQLRHLSSKLLEVQEKERKRIANEIHDSVGQSLHAIKAGLKDLQPQIDHSAYFAGRLNELLLTTDYGIEEVRNIYMGLRPSLIDDLGIIAAVSWYLREFRKTYPDLRLKEDIAVGEEKVNEGIKIIIFRVVQGALDNVVEHSRASLVQISLEEVGGRLELLIGDNGVGFDSRGDGLEKGLIKGIGLASMQERVESSGGVFVVKSGKGKGTMIRAIWNVGMIS
jgi:PAS domain S-box-containing protein